MTLDSPRGLSGYAPKTVPARVPATASTAPSSTMPGEHSGSRLTDVDKAADSHAANAKLITSTLSGTNSHLGLATTNMVKLDPASKQLAINDVAKTQPDGSPWQKGQNHTYVIDGSTGQVSQTTGPQGPKKASQVDQVQADLLLAEDAKKINGHNFQAMA